MPVLQREKCYSRTIDVIRPLNLLENCTAGTELHERAEDLLVMFNRIKNGFDIPSSYTAPDYAFVNKLLEKRLEKAQQSGVKTDQPEELQVQALQTNTGQMERSINACLNKCDFDREAKKA